MNSFLKIGLPILLVAGLVFGLTFMRLYTSDDKAAAPIGAANVAGPANAAGQMPLDFFTTKASPPALDILGKPEGERFQHLKHWQAEVEASAEGGYGYWCQNKHPTAVRIRAPKTSCTCSAVEAANVPANLFNDYLVSSALAGGPLSPSAALAGVFAQAEFTRKLEWATLSREGADQGSTTIPAADPKTGPQLAIVKMTWIGKSPSGPKKLFAAVYAGKPDGSGVEAKTDLTAEPVVVPAFELLRRELNNKWVPLVDRLVDIGELRRNSISKQWIYCYSPTRTYLGLDAKLDVTDPCMTIGPIVPAEPEELAALELYLAEVTKGVGRGVKALYKFELLVRERLESGEGANRQLSVLDLGPIDRTITMSAVEGGNTGIRIRGNVRGEVQISKATSGKIELGNSYPANQDRTADVILTTERPDMELKLIPNEISPKFLKAELVPLPDSGGLKQYRLFVTVPKDSPTGALPETASIVLTTTGSAPRKLRIPVRGQSFYSGPVL